MSQIVILRTKQTEDATFGELTYEGFTCYTMERTAVQIPVGIYTGQVSYSPHFQYNTPHINVPNRTYIEIHPANFPSQLEGCVAIGQQLDGDALDYSKKAFDSLMAILPNSFQVEIVESFDSP